MTDAETSEAKTGGEAWQVVSRTSVGRVRRRNEDALGQAVAPDGAALLVVADGLGRFQGADIASQTAVEVACTQWRQALSPGLDLAQAMGRSMVMANQALITLQKEKGLAQPLATTAVFLALMGDQALIAHAGDSRAYLLRDGTLERLTTDHVEGEREGEARAHSWAPSSLITCCLGIQPEVEVELTGPLTLQQDDVILLCTDGLSRVVDEPWIQAAMLVLTLEKSADALIDMANFAGGPDNVTVSLMRFQPSGEGALTPRPAALIFPHERPERWGRRRNLILAWVLTLACIALWVVQMCS
jgi:PPM family protein phosphatase